MNPHHAFRPNNNNNNNNQPFPKLGQVLVNMKLLTKEQCQQVLNVQKNSGRPFGLIAEELFDINPKTLEMAWAEQMSHMVKSVNPNKEIIDVAVVETITRRQAWQFRMVPLRIDGNEYLVCTTKEHLPRAQRFAHRLLGPQVAFVLTTPALLADALDRLYPMAGAREHMLCAQENLA
jgi:hypothetical protein